MEEEKYAPTSSIPMRKDSLHVGDSDDEEKLKTPEGYRTAEQLRRTTDRLQVPQLMQLWLVEGRKRPLSEAEQYELFDNAWLGKEFPDKKYDEGDLWNKVNAIMNEFGYAREMNDKNKVGQSHIWENEMQMKK